MRWLQDITLGLYLPRDSAVHRLDPRAKLVVCAVLMTAVFVPGGGPVVLCAVPPLVLGVWLSRLPVGLVLRGLRPFVWLFAFTALLHAVTTPGQAWFTVPGFRVPVTGQGLARGVAVAGQLAAAVTFSSLLTLTTRPTELVWGLERLGAPLARLGLPVGEFCVSMLLAIRFFPLVQQEAERLRLALAARGAEGAAGGLRRRIQNLSPLLASLFRRVLGRAEHLALAMELRGFVPGRPLGAWRPYRFATAEWLACGLAGLTLGLALWLRRWPAA